MKTITASRLTMLAFLWSVCGCATDPAAVTSFSALAPDASKLHSLAAAYADAPARLRKLDVLNRVTVISKNDAVDQVKARDDQVVQIDALNAVLVNYMQSLGALANNNLVEASTDTRTVTDGLTALSKAQPALGLTADMISGVGSISTFLGDALTSAYRQEHLASVIEESEGPFQLLIATEKQIVNEGVLKELQNVRNATGKLAEVVVALELNAEEDAAKHRNPVAGSTGVNALDPQLQGQGAAEVASLYLLRQSIDSDRSSLDLQIKAATAYVTALDKISSAHTVLYANRDNILSKEGAKTAIAQLTPLIKDADAALQALKSI